MATPGADAHTYNPKYKLDWTHDSTMVTPRTTKTKAATKPKLMPVRTMPPAEETVMEEEPVDNTKVEDDPSSPPPTETMQVTEEVEANMEEISNLLGSVNNTPASDRKSNIRVTKLAAADTFKAVTPKSGVSSEEDQEIRVTCRVEG